MARATAAILASLVLVSTLTLRARAGDPQNDAQTDAEFAALMRSCASQPTPRPVASIPAAWTFAPSAIVLISDRAQPEEDESPSPSPAASVSPEPSGASSGAPSASPSPPPTLPPNLPPPPRGPGSLIPPTPRPSGTPQVTPPPIPTPTPIGTIVPAEPGPQTTAPPLRPFDIVVMAEAVHGFNREHAPGEATGNVHIFYIEGQLVGDRAQYDGDHTITITGHTYLINRAQDSILYADSIVFDTRSHMATLLHGRGESIEGVQHGAIHFAAEQMTSLSNGVTHGERGSFTTCENPHGGYHVEARNFDLTPGDKLVARKAVVFLGPLAILYLPFLVIPLRTARDPRRPTTFLPDIGYSELEGYYIKARLGFAPSDTYYGYYRVDYATKRGLGLGYSAVIGSKNRRRYLTIDTYTISDHIDNARETNVNLQEFEQFSTRLRGQFGVTYQGDFGAGVSLPPSFNITATLARQGINTNETLTFTSYKQGDLQDSTNLGFLDNFRISPAIQQLLNISFNHTDNTVQDSGSLHINTDTHIFSKLADYDLIYDKTDFTTTPFGYDRVPELQINPHIDWHDFAFAPQIQFTIGQYNEPAIAFNTSRAEMVVDEPIALKLGQSDLDANFDLRQDYYATGDEKATETQDISLTTPFGGHIVNSISYNEQHPIGPDDAPFEILDRLSDGEKTAQDVLRLYNSDIYTVTLGTGTDFDGQAQSVQYQLNTRVSPRAQVILGGYWQPGPGNGFGITNLQALTPFGRDTTLQLTTNVDWKNKGRLENKNIYLSRVVGDCYRIDAYYSEDLKQFNMSVTILAFPGSFTPYGINGPSQILPQNFGGY